MERDGDIEELCELVMEPMGSRPAQDLRRWISAMAQRKVVIELDFTGGRFPDVSLSRVDVDNAVLGVDVEL